MPGILALVALLSLLAAPAAAATASFDDNADSIAVVVGNRNYKQTTPVDFAHNDASAIRDYLVRGLGFRDENVFVLKDATLNELNQAFGTETNPQGGRLWRSVVERRSNVFVYYSGHGVPDLKTRQPFLLPQDGDPNFADSGYALETLYRNLDLVKRKVGAERQVVVMVDACFTGETGRKGENMLAVSAPGFTPAKPRSSAGIVKLAATSGATPANWDDGAKLGLFTSRFLMGAAGLARPARAGEADKDRIQWSDLQTYVTREVETAARRDVGREQAPEIDMASLSLPVVEPAPAIKRGFDRARDETLWRDAETDGSREALERYVGECGEPCAYRAQAMNRLLKRRQSAEAILDHETWRRLSAEGKHQAYLDGCGRVCAYRALALGYLGKDGAIPEDGYDGDARPDGGSRVGLPPEEPAAAPGPAGREDPSGRPDREGAPAAKPDPTPKTRTRADGRTTQPEARTASRRAEPTDAEIRAVKPTAAERAAALRHNEIRKKQQMESVRPEYERRVATQGQAAANAWLTRTATEMGRREGYLARRRILMQRRAAER